MSVNKAYAKGNLMTFPLELTEIKDQMSSQNYKYLYPPEIKGLQKEIEDICDRMEYDGSLMFDACPDKVSINRIVSKICRQNDYEGCDDENGRKWLNALVQVMLCGEIKYRAERRASHKRNMGKRF